MGNINPYIFVKFIFLLLFLHPSHVLGFSKGDINQFVIKLNRNALGELEGGQNFCLEKSTLSCHRTDIEALDGKHGTVLDREVGITGNTWWRIKLSNGQRYYYRELLSNESNTPIDSQHGQLVSLETYNAEESKIGKSIVKGSSLSISQYNSRADTYILSGSYHRLTGERYRVLQGILNSISTRDYDLKILDVYDRMDLAQDKFKGSIVLIPQMPYKSSMLRLIVGLENGEPEAAFQFSNMRESFFEVENCELAASDNHIVFESPVFETKRVNDDLFLSIGHLYFLEKHRMVITSILDDLDATLRFNTIDGHMDYKIDSTERKLLEESIWLYDVLVQYSIHRAPFK